MAPLLLSLTSPAPEGFLFEPAPHASRFRRGVFCLFSDDPDGALRLLSPIVEKIFGLVVAPGSQWERSCLGNFCFRWIVPHSLIPSLSSIVIPYLELMERAHHYEDMTKAQTLDAQRATQDRVFLSRVQIEFRDAMIRADKELRDAHHYLNQIVESLPDPLIVIDRERKVTAWNMALERLTGVPKEEMIGKGDFEYAIPFYGIRRPILMDQLFLPETETKQTDAAVWREGNLIFGEDFIPNVNGGKGAYVLKSAALLYDQEGKVLGAIETIRDITDRKKMEMALKENHAKLDAMANNVPGIVFQFFARPNGSIGFNYISNKASEILGISHDYCMLLDGFGNYVHPDDRQRFVQSVRKAIESASALKFEGRMIKNSNETVWCQVLANPVICQTELVYSGVIVDVTDRHKTMAQLQRAKLAAEEANQAQSRFLSNVSHEIRTPLNGIIGFTELIMQEHSVENIHAMARTSLHESEILLSLVNELLDQARIESGKMEIECAEFETNDLIETVSQTVGVLAKRKGLNIRVEASADVPLFLFGDHLRISQVLLNLMNNAMKFTQQGVITLRIVIERRELQKTWVRFSVVDTGMGIPDDKKRLIFERFAQVDAAATRKYGGTGLGLSVSRGLVELMGGTIGFESVEARGSTFWFVLPFPVKDRQREKSLPCVAGPPTAAKECASASTFPAAPILLVEDYPPNQEVVRRHLEAEGYIVEIVDNGKSALERCEGKKYSLILMDIQMPEMDGFEATRLLRLKSGWTRQVMIIGLTANADEKTRKDCTEAGMDGMITKPIRRQTFLAEVEKRLAGIGSSHSTRAKPPAAVSKPMNYEEALREFMDDKAALDEVVAQFFVSVHKQLADMDSYDGNIAALEREAHKIKGASATLTALNLSDSAAALELKCKSGEASGINVLIDKVKKEFSALETYVKNGYADF
jgi:PAS domain S-box-containing protein